MSGTFLLGKVWLHSNFYLILELTLDFVQKKKLYILSEFQYKVYLIGKKPRHFEND